MSKKKRALAGVLAGTMTALSCIPAGAAAPTATVDETLYVSLDAYGGYDSSSVVKSYSLNGSTTITDHGDYSAIINMTDHATPTVQDGTVTFDLSGEESSRRFYFEGKYDALPVTLPWDIDVSYRLNGVPAAAEDLAGAAGTVEIDLDIVPNTEADAYFRNNLILEAATMVSLDDQLSVEAEGAQMQKVGGMTAIVYMVLPGEEQHYTLRIGTEDFSFAGFFFSMCPATLSQIDRINDLRDAKSDIEDSADAMSDSLDVILDTLDSLQSGLSATSQGLNALDGARSTIASEKGGVYASADEAMESLPALVEALSPYQDDLNSLSENLTTLNARLNALKQTVDETAPELEDVRTIVTALQDDLTAVRGLLDQGVTDYSKWKKALEGLKNNCNALADDLNIMESSINDLEWTTDSFGAALKNVAEGGASGLVNNYAQMFGAGGDTSTATILTVLSTLVATLEKISNVGANLSYSVSDMSVNLEGVFHSSDDLMTSLGKVIDLTDDALTQIDARKDTWYDLIDQAYDAGGILTQLTVMLDALDEQADAALDEINDSHTDILTAITDTQSLIDVSTTSITSLHTFLKSAEATLQKAGNELDAGTQQTLNALIDVLGKTVNGLSQTGTIQNAKDTIKDLIDDKWDEYSGENNNILLMDTEAPPVSLTSSENAAPDSVQIILRTAEITTEDEDEDTDVDEDFHSSGTVFSRIASIFRQLIEAIRGVFAQNKEG